jgi:hypothetical protein
MATEKDPGEGTSFPFAPDLRTKTARPTSVGPHHRTQDQEDPTNPGVKPEKGYAAEIERNTAASADAPQGEGHGPITAPTPPAGREPEDADAPEPVEDPGKAPPVAPTPPAGR